MEKKKSKWKNVGGVYLSNYKDKDNNDTFYFKITQDIPAGTTGSLFVPNFSTLDQAVENGKLTEEQAESIRETKQYDMVLNLNKK